MIIKRFIRVVLGIILLIPLCSCSRFVTFREAPEAYLLNKGYLLISPNIDVIYRFSEIFVPMPELPAPDLANEGVVLYIETDLYGYVKRVGVRYS
ncbi:MAG: hypothetical protein GY757_01435, partial [bacterium]|nr:hypothetical protein [bacterium]